MIRRASLFIAVFSVLLPLFNFSKVSAACSNVSTFGAVEYILPDIPNSADRVLWIRMQIPNSEARVLAEINKDSCVEIGGFEQELNQWSWQAQRQDSKVVKLPQPQDSGSKIKLYGISEGVKIDKVIIAESSCVPQDLGDNCSPAVALQDSNAAIITLPSPKTELSGKVELSSTPSNQSANLKEVVYTVNNKLIQTSQAQELFDTTLLANGEHTVFVTTELKDGSKIFEKITIETNNEQNPFSGLTRWARLNQRGFGFILSVVAFVVLLFVGLIVAQIIYKRRKKRRLKGLDV